MNHSFSLFLLLLYFMGSFPVVAEPTLELLQTHCLSCHGENDKVKGKVDLRDIRSLADMKNHPDLLDQVIEALEYEDMPPEDEPQPTPEERSQLITSLQSILDSALESKSAASSPPAPIRRMTRFQYANAVKDIFGLKVMVYSLPERMMRDHSKYFDPSTGKMPDTLKVGSRPLGKDQLSERRLIGVSAYPQDLRAEHGYDNRGDHLSLSPLLMRSFFTLANSIVNSSNFNKKTVGVWNQLFTPPKEPHRELAQQKTNLKKRLRPFLTAAFRGDVSEETLQRYTSYYWDKRDAGDDHTTAMKAVCAAALVSPKFLYLYHQSEELSSETTSENQPETNSQEESQQLAAQNLASKISFFLHGSVPDSTLRKLAKDGSLLNPDILSKEVERLLNDKKMKRFCDAFGSQWLQLDRLISSQPNREKFPGFYHGQFRTSMWMQSEPLLLFETILIENRSIFDFIQPDFTYRSKELDSFYQTGKLPKRPKIGATEFYRVALDDPQVGGIITNAATLSMTSGTERTHPITRGAWLLGTILNDPPEPPPADVPTLPEDDSHASLKDKTIREVFAIHRERKDCAECHKTIDPLGFALENYDVIGRWRDTYANGRPVDSSGVLFRKYPFSNIKEFKEGLVAEPERFAKAFTAHLFTYALSRDLTALDQASIDTIVQQSAKDNYRFRTLLKHLILSPAFRGSHTF